MKEALHFGDKESEVYKNACSMKVESIYILFTCYLQFPMDTRCSINVCWLGKVQKTNVVALSHILVKVFPKDPS